MKDFHKYKIMYYVKEQYGYRFVNIPGDLKKPEKPFIYNSINNQPIKGIFDAYPTQVKELLDMLVNL